ncbi:LLM class flavin-dependent oxidoreductase [Sphingomonas pituitosa]|uniref:LLM class flavin-dependent oxidoreductase n=1 Tax=Sphingomonas pituitosa TaxID=99597 RepID=UPI00082C9064|nr:LLM class flavin-dependent oxidoreductase [Sphingomonas pituitosa]
MPTVADAIFTHARTIEQGQAFYADIKGRAAALGRNPDDIVILPGFSITIGDTDEDARAIDRELRRIDQSFDQALAEFGRAFGWHDFRQYDLDAPFPVQALEHARSSFYTQAKAITEQAASRGLTLRETVEHQRDQFTSPFVGSAKTVADEIERWFEGRAFDGINVHAGHPSQFRRFTQEVVPLLQARGLFRREYEHTTLRGHLGLPIPANRRQDSASADERPAGVTGARAQQSAVLEAAHNAR